MLSPVSRPVNTTLTQHNTTLYNYTMQCNAIHITMHNNTTECNATQRWQCIAVQCSALQCSALQCSAVQCSAVQYSTIQYQCYYLMCNSMSGILTVYHGKVLCNCNLRGRINVANVSTSTAVPSVISVRTCFVVFFTISIWFGVFPGS